MESLYLIPISGSIQTTQQHSHGFYLFTDMSKEDRCNFLKEIKQYLEFLKEEDVFNFAFIGAELKNKIKPILGDPDKVNEQLYNISLGRLICPGTCLMLFEESSDLFLNFENCTPSMRDLFFIKAFLDKAFSLRGVEQKEAFKQLKEFVSSLKKEAQIWKHSELFQSTLKKYMISWLSMHVPAKEHKEDELGPTTPVKKRERDEEPPMAPVKRSKNDDPNDTLRSVYL